MGVTPFEVHRGEITQSAVEPFWVIERFDVIKDSQGSLGARVKGLMVERFSFERAPERFDGSVVVAVGF